MKRDFSSIAAMAGLLILAQSIAMLMAIPFDEANLQVFEDPYDIANPLLYVGLILLVSVIILAMVKLRRRGVIKHIILVAFGLTILMVFYVVVLLALNRLGIDIDSAALIGFFVGVAVAVVLTYLLYRHPEWYVVDFVGVCVAAAVAAILGISLAILPVFILLIILAIYDAVSVYKTKHMVTLADAVTQERLPVLLVVPRRKGYSFLKQKSIKEQLKKRERRDAVFMGLGDVVIPGVLVVSAFRWLSDRGGLFPLAYLFVAVFTLLGCLIGFLILMRFVLKGNPQAGLPLLNAGAMLGYIFSYLVFFPGDLTFGFFQ